MGVLVVAEANHVEEEMAPRNSKAGNGWTSTVVTAVVTGCIVAVFQVGYNQWLQHNGGNDELVALKTEFGGMRQQLDRIENRDSVSRAEYYRDTARLEERLRDIERALQSRSENFRPR